MPFLVNLIEYRDGAHQRVDIPGAWTGIKFKVFGHNSFMSAICFMFIEVYGLHWSFEEISFFSVLFSSLPPPSSSPPFPSFFSFKHKHSGNRVGQWKKSFWEIKNPFSKIFRFFFPDTLNLYHQRKVCWLWNCKIIVYCELWILVSEGLLLRTSDFLEKSLFCHKLGLKERSKGHGIFTFNVRDA